MIKGNTVAALAALALSLVTYLLADQFPPIVDDAPGPGFVPKVLAGAMAVLAIVLLLQTATLRAKEKREAAAGNPSADDGPNFNTPAIRLSYRLAGLAFMYAVLIGVLGFVIASLLFIPAGMALMGERNLKNMALLSVCVVGVFYGVFAWLFNMPLPHGLLFG